MGSLFEKKVPIPDAGFVLSVPIALCRSKFSQQLVRSIDREKHGRVVLCFAELARFSLPVHSSSHPFHLRIETLGNLRPAGVEPRAK